MGTPASHDIHAFPLCRSRHQNRVNVHIRLVVDVSVLAALAARNHMRIRNAAPLGGRVGRLLVVIVAFMA